MLLKTKLGQNLKKISIFFQSELKQKIWAWKYESDLARIQTLNLSKLWFGKFLKRLTFVQRTFWLPCSSPSLSAFQAQFFALTLSIAFFSPTIWSTVLCLSDCDASHSILRKLFGRILTFERSLRGFKEFCMWGTPTTTIYFKMTVISKKLILLVKSHHDVTQSPCWWDGKLKFGPKL